MVLIVSRRIGFQKQNFIITEQVFFIAEHFFLNRTSLILKTHGVFERTNERTNFNLERTKVWSYKILNARKSGHREF